MQLVVIGVPYAQHQGKLIPSNAAAAWQQAGLVERLAPYVERAIWVSLPPPADGQDHPGLLTVGRQLADTVRTACSGGAFPLILGGDGLLNALGTVAGLQQLNAQLGLAWFDAHSNLAQNQMLSLLAGWGDLALAQELGLREVQEWHILLAGIRALSPAVAARLDNSLMTVWTAKELQAWGKINDLGRDMSDWPPIYLHVDLSVLDPELLPGVRDPQPEGLSPQTLLMGIEATVAAGQVAALSVGNFVPENDEQQGLLTSMQIIEAAVRYLTL